MTTPDLPDTARLRPDGGNAAGLSGLGRADLDHGGKLDKLRLVLVRVVLAEQQLGSRWQLRADASGCAATVTAISPG
jgi:hypothetical protein